MQFLLRFHIVNQTALLLRPHIQKMDLLLHRIVVNHNPVFFSELEAPECPIYRRIDLSPCTYIDKKIPPLELSR